MLKKLGRVCTCVCIIRSKIAYKFLSHKNRSYICEVYTHVREMLTCYCYTKE